MSLSVIIASQTAALVRGIILVLLVAFGIGWTLVRALKKSEDPALLIFKWVLTLPVLAFMVFTVAPMVAKGGYGAAFGGVPLAAVAGLALAIIWRRSIASIIANPFASLYDGGSDPPDPRPAYSIAQSRQKQGKYLEAVAEIRKQLDKFPTDFEGHMLLAQIQVEDLKDLPGAELTIQRLCSQPGHAPANIAFALYSLADWHLKYGADREAARAALEQVMALLPDTEFALTAAQRIAHLGDDELLLASHDRKKFIVTEGPRNLGIIRDRGAMLATEKDPGQTASECIKHLEKYPLDTEAREQLAVIYADHYGRLDLAADQLEQLIQQPHRPSKLVARWLNLLADLQVRCGADYETVKQTLERIVDREPNLAAAETARKRLELLKLEFKARQTNQSVKLGTYEQKLGLKSGGRAKPPS